MGAGNGGGTDQSAGCPEIERSLNPEGIRDKLREEGGCKWDPRDMVMVEHPERCAEGTQVFLED